MPAKQGFEKMATVTEPACTRAYRDKDRLRGCEPVLDGFRDESEKAALVIHRVSDGALQKLTDYVARRLQKQNDPTDVVTRILIVALSVSSAFGGTANRYLQRDCKERMKMTASMYDGVLLGKFMGGRPVGQKMHGAGISRHRALAMKVICEDLRLCKMSLHRAIEGGRDNRDYNVVDLEGSKYVVDLMLEPGALYPWKGFKACAYIDGIQEVKQEPATPERNANLGAKFMDEGGAEEIHKYLETDSSVVEIARPSWHVEVSNVERKSFAPVASGGFGSVYEADYLGMHVAEKRLTLKGRCIDSLHILDFVVEVALMRNLSHPNVLECIGGCVALDARPREMMLLTPWMPNGSLREAILREKVKKSHHLSMSQEMARGLGYLHSRGIVHCDFKSLNVLLDSNMVACIGDFGMARLEGLMEQRIDSGACNGTPAWEAPEQVMRRYSKCDVGYTPSSWRHVEVTHKADVYAFGLVIWEMLNQAIPNLEPRQKLRGDLPELPDGSPWAAVISSCCVAPPENRPDMEKVVHDLHVLETSLLKHKIANLQKQLKHERLAKNKLPTCSAEFVEASIDAAYSDKAQQPLSQLERKVLSQGAAKEVQEPVQVVPAPPKSWSSDLHCLQGVGLPKPGGTKPETTKLRIRPKRASSHPTVSRHSKRPKVEHAAHPLDPEILEAMKAVDPNDIRPIHNLACPAECRFGCNRICSIRKGATLTSYIMLINGSAASTRQQLCQLSDKQCHGPSMPWINFILRQVVLRKLGREQVLALRQKILIQFEAEG